MSSSSPVAVRVLVAMSSRLMPKSVSSAWSAVVRLDGREQHVLGLHVTVDDADPVRRIERGAELADELGGPGGRERAARLAAAPAGHRPAM